MKKIFKWSFSFVVLGTMLGAVSMAADIPIQEINKDVHSTYSALTELSTKDLVSKAIRNFSGNVPIFVAKNEDGSGIGTRRLMPKIMNVLTTMVENEVGVEILRTLMAYYLAGEQQQRIQIRRGHMHTVNGHKVAEAGVLPRDDTGMISMYCFPQDENNLFQADLGGDESVAGIAIDPQKDAQYVALPRISDDEQLAHELLHVIRLMNGSDLYSEGARWTLKFYETRAVTLSTVVDDVPIGVALNFLWQSDEETEVITGKKLKTGGRFQLSQGKYREKGGALYIRVFGGTMIQDREKIEVDIDLVKYYGNDSQTELCSALYL
jgi:hypothetical protein